MFCFSGGASFVTVMQPADLRQRHDSTHFRWLDGSWLRRVLSQGEMGSGTLIILEIRTQDTTQRGSVEHDYVVETLAPD
jgi:hypothetical protein